MIIKYLVFSLLFSSCAFYRKVSTAPKEKPPEVKTDFKLKDQSGEYSLSREAGPGKEAKSYIVKRKVKTFGNENAKTLEKSISISEKTENGVRPKISQFSVWYSKLKHFTQIEFDEKEKQLKVTWESPDPKYNGIKYFPIKKMDENFCFFTQVMECARKLDFLDDLSGQLRLSIIWDGYPFFQQAFENFNTKIISPAVLEFDGKNRLGQKRFSLKVAGDAMFFFVDKKDRFIGQFWISKGLTIEKIKSKM